jgi:hypothetical protein
LVSERHLPTALADKLSLRPTHAFCFGVDSPLGTEHWPWIVLAQIADAHRSVERRGQLSIFGDVPRRDLGALAGLQFKRAGCRIDRSPGSPGGRSQTRQAARAQVVGAIDDEGDFLHHSPSVMPPLRRQRLPKDFP